MSWTLSPSIICSLTRALSHPLTDLHTPHDAISTRFPVGTIYYYFLANTLISHSLWAYDSSLYNLEMIDNILVIPFTIQVDIGKGEWGWYNKQIRRTTLCTLCVYPAPPDWNITKHTFDLKHKRTLLPNYSTSTRFDWALFQSKQRPSRPSLPGHDVFYNSVRKVPLYSLTWHHTIISFPLHDIASEGDQQRRNYCCDHIIIDPLPWSVDWFTTLWDHLYLILLHCNNCNSISWSM